MKLCMLRAKDFTLGILCWCAQYEPVRSFLIFSHKVLAALVAIGLRLAFKKKGPLFHKGSTASGRIEPFLSDIDLIYISGEELRTYRPTMLPIELYEYPKELFPLYALSHCHPCGDTAYRLHPLGTEIYWLPLLFDHRSSITKYHVFRSYRAAIRNMIMYTCKPSLVGYLRLRHALRRFNAHRSASHPESAMLSLDDMLSDPTLPRLYRALSSPWTGSSYGKKDYDSSQEESMIQRSIPFRMPTLEPSSYLFVCDSNPPPRSDVIPLTPELFRWICDFRLPEQLPEENSRLPLDFFALVAAFGFRTQRNLEILESRHPKTQSEGAFFDVANRILQLAQEAGYRFDQSLSLRGRLLQCLLFFAAEFRGSYPTEHLILRESLGKR